MPNLPKVRRAPPTARAVFNSRSPAIKKDAATRGKEASASKFGLAIDPTSKAIQAVDLFRDHKRPLHSPPMQSLQPGAKTLSGLSLLARKVAPGILEDEKGRIYGLSEVLARGTSGKILCMLRLDNGVSRLWIGKQVAAPFPNLPAFSKRFPRPSTPSVPSLVPAIPEFLTQSAQELNKKTPGISVTGEKELITEVESMHQVDSPMAPHAVLRTEDDAFIMMPVADTNLHNVWSAMYHWPAKDRQPIVHVLARQLLEGLSALHEKNLTHNDLKNSNIFLTREGQSFIGDFGMVTPAKWVNHLLGTYEYLAPEVLFDPKHDRKKSDIFSMGAVLTCLLTNEKLLSEELWADTEIVDGLRAKNPPDETLDKLNVVMDNYALAFSYQPEKDNFADLPAGAQEIVKKLSKLEAADPPMYKALKLMQDPEPEKRPTASRALKFVTRGLLEPKSTDADALCALLALPGVRPIRAAADELALGLEANVREYIETKQKPTMLRRNSVGSTDKLSLYFSANRNETSLYPAKPQSTRNRKG